MHLKNELCQLCGCCARTRLSGRQLCKIDAPWHAVFLCSLLWVAHCRKNSSKRFCLLPILVKSSTCARVRRYAELTCSRYLGLWPLISPAVQAYSSVRSTRGADHKARQNIYNRRFFFEAALRLQRAVSQVLTADLFGLRAICAQGLAYGERRSAD